MATPSTRAVSAGDAKKLLQRGEVLRDALALLAGDSDTLEDQVRAAFHEVSVVNGLLGTPAD